MYTVHLLPASFGDSILLEWGDEDKPNYILIDGGPYFNFKNLYPALKKKAPGLTVIELLVVTHIDIDHIDGIVSLLNGKELPFTIKEVWFNGWQQLKPYERNFLGAIQGEYMSHLIKDKQLPHNNHFNGQAVVVKDYQLLPVIDIQGMQLQLLSPDEAALESLVPVWQEEIKKKLGNADTIEEELVADKRYNDLEAFLGLDDLLGDESLEEMMEAIVKGDTSEANGSSIAFIASYESKSCLFSGDATSANLLRAIEPMLNKMGAERLSVSAWKLAHHGSKKSTLDSLMTKIECKHLLVSSDGKRYKHPDQICIAKLLKNNGPNLNLYFNYRTVCNEMWDNEEWQEIYQYNALFPKDINYPGISITL